jgi:hypothetical protein
MMTKTEIIEEFLGRFAGSIFSENAPTRPAWVAAGSVAKNRQ